MQTDSRPTSSLCPKVQVAAVEKIIVKGEKGDIFYIITEGQVRVHDICLRYASYSDQILQAGDWFGECGLMTGEPRGAKITA